MHPLLRKGNDYAGMVIALSVVIYNSKSSY